jgi:alpha-N-arabinofuranosidase
LTSKTLPLILATVFFPVGTICGQEANLPGGPEVRVKYAVKVNPQERRGRVAPGIFGHMVELVGTATYDGVWVGEDSSIPNDGGLRLDTIEAYRQLRAPAFRWPGGTFADSYRWEDGIGPRSQRPRSLGFWQAVEPNYFGTDEFLKWCAAIGAEPIIQTNIGSGSPREIVAWMDYVNGTKDSQYAELRRKNGHPEPYGVKYWTIGNETSYHWTPEEYVSQVRRYGFYMRQAAMDAKIIINGEPGSDWNDKVLEGLSNRLELFDLISLHCYLHPALAAQSTAADTYAFLADIERCQESIDVTAGSIDRWIGGRKHIGIMLDEWGSMHAEIQPETGFPVPHTDRPDLWQQTATLQDALMAARMLHGFMRRANRLALAHLTQSINVIHMILKVKGPRLVRTPTYHVFDMLKHHMNSDVIGVEANLGAFEFEDEGKTRSLPDLDIVASTTGDSSELVVSVVNPHLRREHTIRLGSPEGFEAASAAATVLTGSGPLEINDFDAPNRITPDAVELKKNDDHWVVKLPPFSLTLIRLTSPAAGGS